MTRRARFEAEHPGVFYLDPAEPERLAEYLSLKHFLDDGEVVRGVAKAGDGNMNCTVRVTTHRRSIIVKQSRPWVEKYPQFLAPWDRALMELAFYKAVAGDPFVSRAMPQLLGADGQARLLVLEDVGPGADWTGIYKGETMDEGTLLALADVLSALHALLLPASVTEHLANREMRSLNRAHLFVIPLQENNGLDLDSLLPGLAQHARVLREDEDFQQCVARLGNEVYLADGPALVHGDFFPGSFLRSPLGPRIIDPEFGCYGRPEIDVGMCLAHLVLGRQPRSLIASFLSAYRPPSRWTESVALQMAGVEIMRRLIGYAQLPLGWGLPVRRDLLELSRRLVLAPTRDLLEIP